MYYAGYNDYELIYLVNEGSEPALNVLYQKYAIYINKVAGKYVPRGDKRSDLIQDGLMLLNQSIKKYNPNLQASFYTYFSIVLKRGFSRILSGSYYFTKELSDNDLVLREADSFNKTFDVDILRKYLTKDIDKKIYDECILGNLSIKGFANIYNLEYSLVYRRRKTILLRLKKILTNL